MLEPTGEASSRRRRRRHGGRRQPNITIAWVAGTVFVVAGVIPDQYRSFGHVANWDWLLLWGIFDLPRRSVVGAQISWIASARC